MPSRPTHESSAPPTPPAAAPASREPRATGAARASRARALRLVALAYAVAAAVGWATGFAFGEAHPVEVALWADVAATCAVFAFSVAFSNSSFYDPYWSVAPIPIAAYFALVAEAADASLLRQGVVVVLVAAWGARLTYNWVRGWSGLDQEDWRYVDIRAKSGGAYWPVSFVGIHMMPTLLVFAGCLALWPALASGERSFGWLDGIALAVTAGAIWLEGAADNQLLAFKRSAPPPGSTLTSGLWARSRHPNYLGEILFWWGLWLFGVAAQPSAWWWTLAGPVSITLLFRFVSLPMIENRMRARRPDYAERTRGIPLLLPRVGG